MIINAKGLALLKDFEKCRLKGYKDGGGVPTIGWGHTGHDVYVGQVISQEEADHLLEEDLVYFEVGVTNCLKIMVTSNQFAALVCFAYNVGLMAFKTSTLLQKLNRADIDGAAAEFDKWINDNGQPVEGLRRRRDAEKALFLTPG